AAMVVERRDACGADRDVGETVAPRAPEGVGHEHGDRHPESPPQPGADPARRHVRILRQQRDRAGWHVARVDPGGGEHEAVPCLDDASVTAYGNDAHGLSGDCLLAAAGDDAAFGLADHFARDNDHVAVTKLRLGRSDDSSEIVAGADLTYAVDTPHLEPSRLFALAGLVAVGA